MYRIALNAALIVALGLIIRLDPDYLVQSAWVWFLFTCALLALHEKRTATRGWFMVAVLVYIAWFHFGPLGLRF